MPQPWKRQKDDTPKSFHAFTHYLELPCSERSIENAHAQHWEACESYKGTTKPVSQHWRVWSAKDKWVDRAAAHDEHVQQQRRLRRQEQLERTMDDTAAIARAGRTRVAQALSNLNPTDIPPGALGNLLRQLNVVELRSLGWSPQVELKGQMEHEHKGKIETEVTVASDTDFSKFSLPDLLALREHRQQMQEILERNEDDDDADTD